MTTSSRSCRRARRGHRRKFGEGDKRRIVEKVVQPGASLSEVARRCGYRRVSLSGDPRTYLDF
jgi:transposase-like protein